MNRRNRYARWRVAITVGERVEEIVDAAASESEAREICQKQADCVGRCRPIREPLTWIKTTDVLGAIAIRGERQYRIFRKEDRLPKAFCLSS